jgi:uncharacterized integral membrane protein
MKNKIISSVALLLIVVLFTLQNTEVINIRVLFWTLPVSKALLMFILLGLGVLTGFFLGSYSRKRDGAREEYPPTSSI